MPRKDAILKIRISEDLKSEVEAVADTNGESLAVIVRQALRDYLDRLREKEDKHRQLTQLGTTASMEERAQLKAAEPGAEYNAAPPGTMIPVERMQRVLDSMRILPQHQEPVPATRDTQSEIDPTRPPQK